MKYLLCLTLLAGCAPTTWSGDVYQCPQQLLEDNLKTLTEVKAVCQPKALP